MKTFDKADNVFIQAAADETRRPELIKATSRRRTIFFWCAVLFAVCALVMLVAEINEKTHNSGAAGAEFFVAAMIWMQVLKFESDLRLLKLVEKLKSSTR